MRAHFAMTDRERTLWRCRRGMLELDLIFQRFIERDFSQLTDPEHAALVRLLDFPDPDLLDFFNGVAEPRDLDLQALVRRILG